MKPMKKILLFVAALVMTLFNEAEAAPAQVKLEWITPPGQEKNYSQFQVFTSSDPTLPVDAWNLITNVPGSSNSVIITVDNSVAVNYYVRGVNEWGSSSPSLITNTPPFLSGYRLKINSLSLSGSTGTVNLQTLVPDEEIKWVDSYGWYVSTNITAPVDSWPLKAESTSKSTILTVDARYPTFYVGRGSNFWGWGSFGESTNLNSLPVGGFEIKRSRP